MYAPLSRRTTFFLPIKLEVEPNVFGAPLFVLLLITLSTNDLLEAQMCHLVSKEKDVLTCFCALIINLLQTNSKHLLKHMDQPKVERILRLMKLMSGALDYDIGQLARALDTSPRSVYRYIDTFKSAGFVVYKKGNNSVYKLGKEGPMPDGFDDLIHFTLEEANVFNQLLDALDDANVLKNGLRHKLSVVLECTAMQSSPISNRNAENIARLRQAMESRSQVLLRDYASAHSSVVRDRIVEPFDFSDAYVQVFCFDVEAQDVRTFKVARIGSVEIMKRPWQFEAQHRKLFVDIFRMSGTEPKPFDITLSLRARNLLLEEYPQSAPLIEQDGADRWRLRAMAGDYAGVGRFVLGLADDVQVNGPEEFRSYLNDKVKRMHF